MSQNIRKNQREKTGIQFGIAPNNPTFRGVFSWKEASRTGIPRRAFKRLVSDGTVQQVRRGYYAHKDSKLPPESRDFAIACKHFGPEATIGGLTALFHYGLTEIVPKQVWVIVPQDRRSGPPLFRCGGSNQELGQKQQNDNTHHTTSNSFNAPTSWLKYRAPLPG